MTIFTAQNASFSEQVMLTSCSQTCVALLDQYCITDVKVSSSPLGSLSTPGQNKRRWQVEEVKTQKGQCAGSFIIAGSREMPLKDWVARGHLCFQSVVPVPNFSGHPSCWRYLVIAPSSPFQESVLTEKIPAIWWWKTNREEQIKGLQQPRLQVAVASL